MDLKKDKFLLNVVHILFISMSIFQCHIMLYLIDMYFQNTYNLIILKLISFINSRIVNIEINAK